MGCNVWLGAGLLLSGDVSAKTSENSFVGDQLSQDNFILLVPQHSEEVALEVDKDKFISVVDHPFQPVGAFLSTIHQGVDA